VRWSEQGTALGDRGNTSLPPVIVVSNNKGGNDDVAAATARAAAAAVTAGEGRQLVASLRAAHPDNMQGQAYMERVESHSRGADKILREMQCGTFCDRKMGGGRPSSGQIEFVHINSRNSAQCLALVQMCAALSVKTYMERSFAFHLHTLPLDIGKRSRAGRAACFAAAKHNAETCALIVDRVASTIIMRDADGCEEGGGGGGGSSSGGHVEEAQPLASWDVSWFKGKTLFEDWVPQERPASTVRNNEPAAGSHRQARAARPQRRCVVS